VGVDRAAALLHIAAHRRGIRSPRRGGADVKDSWKVVPFEGLRRSARKRVASLGTPARLKNGRVVMKQGTHDRWFYVVVAGTAVVQHNGVDVHLLGPGDWFGEVGAMTPGGASAIATVVAFCDLEVRVYDPREFATLMEASPAMHERLMRSMLRTARELAATEGGHRSQAVDPAAIEPAPPALHVNAV
jgi:CRP-like cAMP-binding protein